LRGGGLGLVGEGTRHPIIKMEQLAAQQK
jgi:hypothetical protein